MVLAGTFIATGCGFDTASEDPNAWVGTITTEGDVTTVVNEGGSLWGGTATLVEEASIGVENGLPEYMLGQLGGLWAGDDRIYVIDRQLPIVRIYDYDGRYLGDLGGPGEGPGEYTLPAQIVGAADGRLFLFGLRQLNVYAADGTPMGKWPTGSTNCCLAPLVVTADGVPWIPSYRPGDDGESRDAVQAQGPEGPTGDFRLIPEPETELPDPYVRADDRAVAPLPFAPQFAWTLLPDASIVSGSPIEYGFRVERLDGSIMIVERRADPVPVLPEEAEFWRRFTRAAIEARNVAPGRWDGAIPGYKPAFAGFIGSTTGEIWVLRETAGRENPGCVDPSEGDFMTAAQNLCWERRMGVDAFAADGRFLGAVELPEELPVLIFTRAMLRGDALVTELIDDAGTIMVKRYRLVPPGEGLP
jgi:hypothetical protein